MIQMKHSLAGGDVKPKRGELKLLPRPFSQTLEVLPMNDSNYDNSPRSPLVAMLLGGVRNWWFDAATHEPAVRMSDIVNVAEVWSRHGASRVAANDPGYDSAA